MTDATIAAQTLPTASSVRLHQLDVLRALAACGVIVIHTVGRQWLLDSWAVLHVWQALPLFVALMGASAMLSGTRRGLDRSLSGSASLTFVRSRLGKLLWPFAVLWVLALLFGLWRGSFYFGPKSLLLLLPVTGPGNYFVAIAVQLAILTPLLVFSLSRAPLPTLVLAGALTLGFELISAGSDVFDSIPYVYDVAALRYLFLFALAMWATDRQVNGKPLPWIPLALYLAASIAYMLFVARTGNNLYFPDAWGWQNLASFGNVLIALLVGIRLLPRVPDYAGARVTEQVSQASYHVFLFQLAYFALLPGTAHLGFMPLNLAVCLAGGVLLFEFERALRRRLLMGGA
ncbi:MAG: acyltransferase [Coriobacteriales bacterium]|nr:acyltransferase [Coriobacteriales bacterium]